MNVVAVTDFRNNISDYLNRVIYTGEDLWIKKGKNVLAKLVKADSETKKPNIIDLAGVITEKEADKLNAYIESLDTWDNDTP